MGAGEVDDLHSAAWFGAYRDFWWNADHLELCARRLRFDEVGSVLDVGSGVGHWGMLLAHVLPGDARVTGVDREPAWTEEATRRAAAGGLADRFGYMTGEAEALPFEDDSFDLVTCQTLLVHVADVVRAVREMMRVTRPGGLVLASEPNNQVATLVTSSTTAGAPVEEMLDLTRFYLTCERGHAALGRGHASAGDLVPGAFADAGLTGIEAWLSDKVGLMLPPYATEEQQALKAQFEQDAERGAWGWTHAEARRCWIAGGGAEDEFEASWERRMAESRRDVDAIDDGTFRWPGGDILYLVAGRKPL
ncbi:MAG: hypothetical protein QOJ57_259 [Thermoleophilaceae bacterium]|nr:hypothetical protein [Thermoleophilaceae bacterium]